ncbi:MAG: hypothetical protein MMC33_010132 [Icmadophila ericetorum]|nr:hypothetical protein [Icmadophila ericetorum]
MASQTTTGREEFLQLPRKPLKILTIDGGGLQGISTLLILSKVLDAIAAKDGTQAKKPRPCDIFDVIAGIGAGGWLAILLGRFHLDIGACLDEWYDMMQVIQPSSRTAGLKFRFLRHCYYDTDKLTEQIDQLTKIYGTGEDMMDKSVDRGADKIRCRHVFVAALEENGAQPRYNLFRTYKCPKDAEPLSLRPGPEYPERFKITRAFAVTGAARYFAPTWKETMENGHKAKFRDTKFPYPHNVTELALDEMWGLYGKNVRISVVLNIGPGLPSKEDVHNLQSSLAKIVSWPPSLLPNKRSASPAVRETGDKNSKLSPALVASGTTSGGRPGPSVRGGIGTLPSDNSIRVDDRDVETKLQRKEREIEKAIKEKLEEVYPVREERPRYFRVALDKSPKGAPPNDTKNPKASQEAVRLYCESINGETTITRVKERFDEVGANDRESLMSQGGENISRDIVVSA